MKKLALLLFAILVLAIAAVYYLIPGTLVVSETVKINCIAEAAFRNLSDEQSWGKWWPGTADAGVNAATGKFSLGNNRYSLSRKVTNNFEILVESKDGVIPGEMNLFSIPHDSTLVRWRFTLPAGNNPFKRIAAYARAVSLKSDMHTILTRIQTYLSDFKNVYGFSFREASTKDTLLITTKSFSAERPTTDFVYALINKLKNFCSSQNCNITGMPMLNVTSLRPAGFQVMVALPVNRLVQEHDSVSIIKMVPGKFIITDVVGGLHTIAQTYQQLHFYFQDYRRTTMAIPFEYLLTNRQQETDTSKWVTRIYAPVY